MTKKEFKEEVISVIQFLLIVTCILAVMASIVICPFAIAKATRHWLWYLVYVEYAVTLVWMFYERKEKKTDINLQENGEDQQ